MINETYLLPGNIAFEFIGIPAGTFVMGSPKDETDREMDEIQHNVTISQSFQMGKYQVTQEQYQAVMGENPSLSKGAKRPVDNVSWENAKAFCDKLNELYAGKLPAGYRIDLPTESQWEYAYRAGTTTPFYSGTFLKKSDANFKRDETCEVGTFKPNPWGLYDMEGNVWEWCRDWYGPYPEGDVTDPQGLAAGERRVLRGGSWLHEYWFSRASNRYSQNPQDHAPDYGFRLAIVPIQ